ncbi:MAG: phosphatase PAP2 family protein [Candidatus Yanofskybacteria bacterium]|nr:phosphatase PAP2 family protein [Candidatus Yanofskybacteria bacterium]
MNISLFQIINSWAGKNYWLDRFMIFSAEWLGYFLILLLITPLLLTFFIRNDRFSSWIRYVLLRLGYYREMLSVSLVSAILARFIFVEAIRFFYYNPRPFLVFSDVTQLVNHETASSFPSGHASFYFALVTGVYLYNKKLGYIYLALAGLIGFARVFVGVHWPADIVAGAILGTLVAVAVRFMKQKMPRRALS